ncbi:hypothetical protein ACLQ2H_09790 [Streptomyces globisporus]|uniref:hypothetical protein n=1 Tax=Streptomyces globisporus TaxID=1908 RepID=UPI003CF27384
MLRRRSGFRGGAGCLQRDASHVAVTGAGLLLHLTDWPQYSDVDPGNLVRSISAPKVIDARGTLDAKRWRAAGWTFRALGRP